jgi:UDP-N-acetylglucosamine diphosphorylase/glucosamine-1-phosphate N-acetyltransferase
MKNLILFDPDTREQLLPLSFTRPVADFRIGILTIREKWEKRLNGKASYITQDYLSEKFPISIAQDNYVINGAVLPNEALCKLIEQLQNNEALLRNGELVAARLDEAQFLNLMEDSDIQELAGFELPPDTPYTAIDNLWDIFKHNDLALRADFDFLTRGRSSAPLSTTNQVLGNPADIFLEEGAVVECSILNAAKGPIYIGKNAEIMEGCIVRGPFAMGANSILKMGARIYGATTLGEHVKVGGEVTNSVIFSYSNKAHDGYLGNSVLGEWCNLGADTNTSNLKNNYEEIKLWSYPKNTFVKTGLQFLGLIMGDHSKCGINTMFNTGTVVGVSANIFGAGYPRNFIASFCWGGTGGGYETYQPKKAFDTIARVMERRNLILDDTERGILQTVFDLTAQYRHWEKTGV